MNNPLSIVSSYCSAIYLKETNPIMSNSNTKNSLVCDKNKEKYQYSTDLVRIYLQEIGRIPLLTEEEEIVYGKQVQRMMNLLSVKKELEIELNHEPTILEWADKVNLSQETLLKQLNQGRIAKEKIIRANLRLVVSIAKKYQKCNLEFMDLIQEGSLGLERAVEKFDPIRGYKFSTYAYWWIRQGMTRAISQKGRTIRLPIHVTDKLNKIKRVQRELSQILGRNPNVIEIAQALSLEPEKIREYLQLARKPVSLEMPIGGEKDSELQDVLEDKGLSAEFITEREFLSQDIDGLLLRLNPQQREVIGLRFGLIDGNQLTLLQIGQRMGLSRERVRQIEKQAMSRLERCRNHSMRSYLVN